MDRYDIRKYIKPALPAQKPSGILDATSDWRDVTPAIGREYASLNLKDILASDELVKELALIVSHRHVVFFRNQTLTPAEQKGLAHRLGLATGKPKDSRLHIHPMMNASQIENQELADIAEDNEISVISSRHGAEKYKERFRMPPGRSAAKPSAHQDSVDASMLQNIPSDYIVLKVIETPEVGGDTLWASGYAMFEKLSKPFQDFLQGLTVTFRQPVYRETAATNGFSLYTGPRGSPHNINQDFEAVHPLIRTNPVTGKKAIFAFGQHLQQINQVTEAESNLIMDMIKRIITENHDLQVRFSWNKNDVAIWDNRSCFHTATYDHNGPRIGVRAVSIGERPFLSP